MVWSAGNAPRLTPATKTPVWAALTSYGDRRRNIPLAQLLESLEHPGVEFYSLQKGEQAESELAALKAQAWKGPHLIEHAQQDFADTAALIEQLDLVVSVDTSVAHVAGALGKRTWMLLPFYANWRWLLERTDSPWYPSFRLYRQAQLDDWSAPLAQMGADLHSLAAKSLAMPAASERPNTCALGCNDRLGRDVSRE